MKMYEALSMLCAARDGQIPTKRAAVAQYGEQSKRILRNIGMKKSEIYDEYPEEMLQNGLFLVTNHPIEFTKQAKAAASWLVSQN